jgi:alkaline phosphatase
MPRMTPVIALTLICVLWGASAAPGAETDPTVISKRDVGFYKPSRETTPYPNPTDVKNVILMIGDGMGYNQVAMARLVAAGQDGKLYMERMGVKGNLATHSASSSVTDSAAAGTALSSGIKTKNGMIGMTADGTAYQTILEAARDKGMATGIAVTCCVTHATPAAFYARAKSRSSELAISPQIFDKVDVILGGGRHFFLPKESDGKRTDGVDLIQQALDSGYTYVHDAAGLKAARGPRVLGLFQMDALKTVAPEPDLAGLTAKAISTLNAAPNGFFLMVEGSQIDWACHGNNARESIRQTLLFDQAVKTAVDFALKDRRTLVLVTADHETGGLTVNGWDPKTRLLDVEWSTKGHTGVPVPLYALGPRAELFQGEIDNTDVPKRIAAVLGIADFPKKLD